MVPRDHCIIETFRSTSLSSRSRLLLGSILTLHGQGKIDEFSPDICQITTLCHQCLFNGGTNFLVQCLNINEACRIDDCHIKVSQLQQEGMHSGTKCIISTKRERKITHSSAGMATRIEPLKFPGGKNEISGIGIVLFDTGGNRENIGIEDNIFIPDPCLTKQGIAPLCYGNLTFIGSSLSLLIKQHDHHCMTVAGNMLGMGNEGFFTLFQTD